MKKMIITLALISTLSVGAFAQYCGTSPNGINPGTGTNPGFTPSYEHLPCMVVGQQITDTLYFTNWSSFGGQSVQSVTFDSIGNLPYGLCWSSNSSTNTFAGGANGAFLIHGICNAAPGQYTLGFYCSATAGAITLPPYTNMSTLAGLYYFVRVICADSACPALDTVNGKTQPYIAYNSCAQTSVNISANGSTNICTGSSVQLNSTVSPSGTYQYQWYLNGSQISGATSSSYNASVSGNYYVVVTNGGSPVSSNSLFVTVNSANASITPSGSTTFCQGGSVSLTATSGSAYNWSNGLSSQTINVTTGGGYTVTVSDPNGCNTTLTASTTVTVNPLPTVSITPLGSTNLCGGSSVSLEASTGSTYLWNTSSNLQTISVSSAGTYSVTVSNGNGCDNSASITVTSGNGAPTPSICIVSVDPTTNENEIVWQKGSGYTIDSFKVYVETSIAGVYQLIRVQPYADFSTYIDVSSNPSQQSSTYVLTDVDQCGESAYSAPHETIHLTSNLGVGGVVNLIWNAYVGFNYPSFYIYRGTSASNMQLLTTVASNILSYTDLTPPSPPIYYQIAVTNPGGCVPSIVRSSYNSSLSNVINVAQTGVTDLTDNSLKVYYTKVLNGDGAIKFSMEITEPTDINLYDLSGRLVMHQANWEGIYIPIDASVSDGIYIISMQNSTMSISSKLPIIK